MNYLELEPGGVVLRGLRAHHDQEEVLYAQSGETTFDVADRPDSSATESVTVGADEVIRVSPASSRRGTMTRTATTGSWGSPSARPPADTSEMRSNRCCTAPSAARRPAMASLTDEDSFQFTCNECGNVVSF